MLKPFLVAASLMLCGFPAMLQEAQPPGSAAQAPANPAPAAQSKIPPEAANQVNPVHPTPQSQARAKDIYGFDCAMCHGANGDGKGDFNTEGKMKLLDYRDPSALKGLTDGEIFYIIENGKGDMPPEDGRAKPDEVWNLVIYLRSFAKGQPAAPGPG